MNKPPIQTPNTPIINVLTFGLEILSLYCVFSKIIYPMMAFTAPIKRIPK